MPPQNSIGAFPAIDLGVSATEWREEATPTRLLSIAIAKRRELYQARDRDFRRELLHSGMIKALCSVIGEGRAANRRSRNNRNRSRRRKRRRHDEAWANSIECDWESSEEGCDGSDDEQTCVRSSVAGGGSDPHSSPSSPFTHHHILPSSDAEDSCQNGGIQATGATAANALLLPMSHDQLVPREGEKDEEQQELYTGEPARKRFRRPTPPIAKDDDERDDPFGLKELFTFSPIRTGSADACGRRHGNRSDCYACRDDAGTGSAKAHGITFPPPFATAGL